VPNPWSISRNKRLTLVLLCTWQVVIKARVSTSGTGFSESLKSELNVYMALNAQGHHQGIPCLYSAGRAAAQQCAGQELLAGQCATMPCAAADPILCRTPLLILSLQLRQTFDSCICSCKLAASLLSAGVHKLSPSSSASGKKAVCVSYIAIQRLGPSIWTSCHKKQGPQQVSWRPSRQDMLLIASGMLKVGRAAAAG
jgi:hypothetical protein